LKVLIVVWYIDFHSLNTKMKKFWVGTLLAVVAVFTIINVENNSKNDNTNAELKIVSTVGMIDDIVLQLAGDLVDNHLLMPAGTDPHVYVPVVSDVSMLDSADVIFALGLDLEAQMTDALNSLSKSRPVYFVGNTVDNDKLIAQGENYFDPHIWFDLDLYSQMVEVVGASLVELLSEHESLINDRLANYLLELEQLDLYARESFSAIPESNKWIVTTHDAFSYFARSFDFNIKTLKGVSTNSDYSLKDKQDLQDVILSNSIPAIFVEDSVSSRDLDAVMSNIRDQGLDIKMGGTLFADSLGSPGSEFETFVSCFKSNVDIITKALK